ncbi:MAG: N-acetylmuramoyl-L-alanine amidase [Myxococcales bacterium FL481]|nr:MAG: N-acetylmuramoyl-L-alanine amidase [Myxococcales bacterium FL481]
MMGHASNGVVLVSLAGRSARTRFFLRWWHVVLHVAKMRTAAILLGLAVWLTATTGQPAPRPVTGRRFVVALDPGHGGSNTGCHGHRVEEKELTLRLAIELRDELARRLPRAQVVLTRVGDDTMTLAERTATANRVGADVLLSIHANASMAHDQTGFETFVLAPEIAEFDATAGQGRGREVGAVERSSPVGAMLRELEYQTNRRRAAELATSIQRQQAVRFPARANRGVRPGPFDVLMGAAMPAVLTEVGFLDHREEGADLMRPDVQAQIVDGLAEALVEYYRNLVRTD